MAAKEIRSAFFNPAVLLAGILGLVQAVVWFILSLLAILSYRCALLAPDYTSNTRFSVALIKLYFEGYECPVPDLVFIDSNNQPIIFNLYLSPADLNGWMCAYLAINVVFFVTSVSLLWLRKHPGTRLTNWLRGWNLCTLAFLIMDLALTILFGEDYGLISDAISKKVLPESSGWLSSVPGALMAIAARGFILWLVNLALFIYFLGYVINWNKLLPVPEKKVGLDLNDPKVIEAIEAYNSAKDDWKQSALVPVHYFDRPRVTRPWEEYQRPHVQPSTSEGVTNFGVEERPRQRIVVWDEPEPRRRQRDVSPQEEVRRPANLFDEDTRPRTSISRKDNSDFDHNIRNFEPGRPVLRPNLNKPFGAPVRVPPTQAVPKSDNFYY